MGKQVEELKGIRDLTLTAIIRAGSGKTTKRAIETTLAKDASIETIKQIVQDYENILIKRYSKLWDYDDDEIYIDIKDNLGWTGVMADGGRVTGYALECNPFCLSSF